MSLGLITPLPGEMTEDTQDAPTGLTSRRHGKAFASFFQPPWAFLYFHPPLSPRTFFLLENPPGVAGRSSKDRTFQPGKV